MIAASQSKPSLLRAQYTAQVLQEEALANLNSPAPQMVAQKLLALPNGEAPKTYGERKSEAAKLREWGREGFRIGMVERAWRAGEGEGREGQEYGEGW
jgi:hypothetical protein